ncbi:PIN2/TERF1-interacting telomerase inhibitor 1 isoform X2 [Gasterosteus aculeatus]
MAMLAAPRKKVKWSVDPRNTSWSNDESKFGHKMMERMGWSKGKGLGRSEQGSTENIKVKVKNDNYGLGTMASYEDNWIAHQDDFNELLAQLNNCHGQNGSAASIETPPVEEAKGFSLEEKSKTSKKRVHYMKFTKGKDLSSRSETDLNCIFGKRGKAAKSREQQSDGGGPPDETEPTCPPAAFELDAESITKTVKSALTMQEYFARRMADLKRASEEAPSTETNETSGPTNEPVIVIDDGGGEPKKKKKKKKKNKNKRQESEDLEVVEENSTAVPVILIEDDEDERGDSSGKKKKKRKVNENCGAPSGGEQNCEALPPSKKKKKKQQQQHEGTELLNGHGPTDDHAVDSEVVDKKKPIEKPGDEIKEEELVAKKSKKDKKKKKKHQ